MWSERKPSTRVSQLPALPPIVSSPRQQTSEPGHTHQGEPESSSHAVSRRSRDQPLPPTSSGKLLLLESRVSALEQANRALLEELVRVQADAKARETHQQEEVRNSRQEVERLRETVDSNAGVLEGLERRVFENERSIERGRGTVDLLVESTRETERGVHESQAGLLLRLKKEEAEGRMEQVRGDLYRLEQKCLQFQEGIGRDCGGLLEEVRRLRSGLEVQSVGMESAVSGIRQHLKRLEVEHDSMEDGLSRVETTIGRLESTGIQLRKQLDSKISEVGGGLVELRGALAHLENEKMRQELWLKESFSQLQEDISWVSQKTSDSFHTIAMEMEKNEKNAASEHAQLVTKVTTALEENAEGRINCQKRKECLEMQIGELEKSLQTDCAARCGREAETSLARREELRAKVEKQLESLRSNMEQEQQSMQRGLTALLGSLSVLEGEEGAAREALCNVLNAEIRTRQEEVAGLQLQCGSLQEAWWKASEGLREGLESLEGRMAADRSEMLTLQQKAVSEWQEMGQRMMADVDTRVSALHEHIITSNSERKQAEGGVAGEGVAGEGMAEEGVAGEGVAEEGMAGEGMAEEGVAGEGVAKEKPAAAPRRATPGSEGGPLAREEWRGAMGTRVGALEKGLDRLGVALRELQVKLVGQVQQETNQRFHSVLDLRNEIANIHAQMSVLFEDPRAYNHPVRIAYYDGHSGRGDDDPLSTHFGAGGSRQLGVAREGSSERRDANPLRGYPPIVPKLTQGRPKGSELNPRVGALLFRDWRQTQEPGTESYLSEEDSDPGRQSDSEGERTEERPTLIEATNILVIPHERDRVENTTEPPPSPHSSTGNSPGKASKGLPLRVESSQRHGTQDRNSLHAAARHYEAAETQDTFTSSAPTPDSQRKLRPSHEYTSDQEEVNNVTQASVNSSTSVELRDADVMTASDHRVPPDDESASGQPALPLALSVTERSSDGDSPSEAAALPQAEPAGNSPGPASPEIRQCSSDETGDAIAWERGVASNDVRSDREVEVASRTRNTSSGTELVSQRDQGLTSSRELIPHRPGS